MKKYRIQYNSDSDICILTAEVIRGIIKAWLESSNNKSILITKRLLFSQEYEAYLIGVINTCRNQDGFKFPYIKSFFVTDKDLELIFRIQLKRLFINGKELQILPERYTYSEIGGTFILI